MTLDVSLNQSQPLSTAPSVAPTPAAQPAAGPAPGAAHPVDTVKLSGAAQAKSLHQQGQTAKSIASSLGTDIATVDSYLNIQAAAAPAPAPTGKGAKAPEAPEASSSSSAPAAAPAAPVSQPAAAPVPTAK